MWQLLLDIVFWTFNIISVVVTLSIVVEPIWDAISKRVKARRYRRSLASEAVPKPKRSRW